MIFGDLFPAADSESDQAAATERTLDAYSGEGPSSFGSVNGAWVAVLWDGRERRARFARDVTGIYTLYVARLKGRVAFASNLDVLRAATASDDLDGQALAEFLHYLYVPAPRTTSPRCLAVLPGHVLVVDEASSSQQPYAGPRFVPGPPLGAGSAVEAAARDCLPEFEERLVTAVADCVPRHGRVALMLSGGKDSSTLAVALAKVCPDRVLAVNVGAREPRFDEGQSAGRVCDFLGLPFRHYVPTDQELARGIYEFAALQDMPIGDPASLPYYLALRALPPDCEVVLDGTGNDYYFGIPSAYKGVLRYERRLQAAKVVPKALWPLVVAAMSRGPRKLRALSEWWGRPVEECFVAWEGWSQDELAALFGRAISFEGTHLWDVMRQGGEWLDLLTRVVCGIWEPHAAYRKGMHAGQVVGRRMRYPMADGRLAAFVNTLPRELKFTGSTNKILLRAYMESSLPREVLEKPKGAFVFDLNLLLSNPVHDWPGSLDRSGLLRCLPDWSDGPIRALLRAYRRHPGSEALQHRVYAICLLATVLAAKRGYSPEFLRDVGRPGFEER